MRRHAPYTYSPDVRHRFGVTLVEVLMALMIMAIGITMVMTLFPVSTLRTLQATQLTNATILAQNVKSLIEMDRRLVFNPDFDNDLNEHFGIPGQENYIVDPIGYGIHLSDGNVAAADFFGGPGGIPRHPGFSVPASVTLPFDSEEARALRQLGRSIGSQGDGWTTLADIEAGNMTPISNGTGIVGVSVPLTIDVSSMPYSNGLGTGVPLIDVDTSSSPTAADRGNYHLPDQENARIVVFSVDGRISQSFPLTHVNTDAVDHDLMWSEDIDADGTEDFDFNQNGTPDFRFLPLEFSVDTDANNTPDAARIGRILLQVRRPGDYTWMLSVRRRTDEVARSVDIVTRYRNAADLNDEIMFNATFIPNRPVVGIDVAGLELPEIKKGAFVFNVTKAKWYRVQDIQERPAFGWPSIGLNPSETVSDNYEFILQLDANVRGTDSAGDDGADGLLNGVEITDWNDDLEFGKAMFPTGVIDVFPVGHMLPE